MKIELSQPETRERAIAFARFVWRRFLDDKCFEAAGAMSYTTLFGLVPLTTAALGIISAFPVFAEWSERLTEFIFANFVPASGQVVRGYLTDFAANAAKLTSAGVLALLVSALVLMSSIENQFNMIWRVPPRRRRLARFVVYWTVLTLGPLLLAASIGAGTDALARTGSADSYGIADVVASVVPFFVTWFAVMLSFLVVPNAVVRPRNAAIGALVAAMLFELAKFLLAMYLRSANYDEVYGALAVIPVFLIWIYVCWVVILLGASLAASLSAFRFQPKALRVPHGLEFAYLLRMYRNIVRAGQQGTPVTRAQLELAEPGLTDEQLDRFFKLLREHQLVQLTDASAYVALRDPATVRLNEIFDAGRFGLPGTPELERLRARGDPDDAPLLEWLSDARAAVQGAFAVSAARIMPVEAPRPA
ncbi:MAG TPA: YihY family inner membrane protein [Candidatus Saccharimonadia bacterium]|nr:YihY family inner membrane protein [Candidatus Saccharimonadia bacterium]